MTKNKEKQSHKTSDEMQHGVVKTLTITLKCHVTIGIATPDLSSGRSVTFRKSVTKTVDWKMWWFQFLAWNLHRPKCEVISRTRFRAD
jgi:hypothetical protein